MPGKVPCRNLPVHASYDMPGTVPSFHLLQTPVLERPGPGKPPLSTVKQVQSETRRRLSHCAVTCTHSYATLDLFAILTFGGGLYLGFNEFLLLARVMSAASCGDIISYVPFGFFLYPYKTGCLECIRVRVSLYNDSDDDAPLGFHLGAVHTPGSWGSQNNKHCPWCEGLFR